MMVLLSLLKIANIYAVECSYNDMKIGPQCLGNFIHAASVSQVDLSLNNSHPDLAWKVAVSKTSLVDILKFS